MKNSIKATLTSALAFSAAACTVSVQPVAVRHPVIVEPAPVRTTPVLLVPRPVPVVVQGPVYECKPEPEKCGSSPEFLHKADELGNRGLQVEVSDMQQWLQRRQESLDHL